jgi:hypothetical protein
MSGTLLGALHHYLRSFTGLKFRALLIGFSILIGVNVVRICLDVGYYNHAFKCSESTDLFCGVTFRDSYLAGITAGLAFSVICLWSRRAIGFLLSLLALVWVGVNYIFWYLGTLSIMRANGIESFKKMPDQDQYVFTLNNASQWDVIVMLIVLGFIVWQGHILMQVFKVTRTSHYS